MGVTKPGPQINFAGEVIRRDSNDYGLVKFDGPTSSDPELGFFTHEVSFKPGAKRAFRKGARVYGRAARFGQTCKILTMDPE